MVGYDLESTGTNPLEARIVTAAVVHVEPGQRPRSIEWVLDPGCEVPAEAAAIHGWTRTRILAEVGGEGRAIRVTRPSVMPNQMTMTVDGALGEIVGHIGVAMHTDTPLVIANAAYDLTLTETECARLDVDTLTSRPAGIRGVVDPMVLDKVYDPYRKVNRDGGCQGGKYRCGGCGATDKKLGSLCAHYGVRLTGAHNAAADALAAVRLTRKFGDPMGAEARWKLATLHAHQIEWRREQMDGLRSYFDKNQIEHDGCDGGWPLHTSLSATLAGATT